MQYSTAPHDARWQERYDEAPARRVDGGGKVWVATTVGTPDLRSFFAEDLEQQPVEPIEWIVDGFIPNPVR